MRRNVRFGRIERFARIVEENPSFLFNASLIHVSAKSGRLNASCSITVQSQQPFGIARPDLFCPLQTVGMDDILRFRPSRHRVAVIKIAADDDVVWYY
jgi:hypothetical protein